MREIGGVRAEFATASLTLTVKDAIKISRKKIPEQH